MPKQNGVAKRKNRTIEEATKAMLEEKHMPKLYWAEVVRTVVYLQIWTSANGGVSPNELYYGKTPNLAHLRIFGSIAYMHVPKEKQRKLDAKSEKCILVGYSDEQKEYKCYNPRTKEVRVNRDVVFDDSTSWYLPSPPIPDQSIPNFEEEVSNAELPLRDEEIGALSKSPISFQLSGPNEGLSRDGQPNEESASGGDSAMLSSHKEPRRIFTRKGKKKMSAYNFGSAESDRSESNVGPIKKEPP